MKMTLMLLAVLFSPSDDSVDVLIARAVQAMGGYEKLKAIRSLHYQGPLRDGRLSRSMAKMRPGMRLIGCVEKLCGYTDHYLEGYDGKRGWEMGTTKGRLIWTKRDAETALRCGSFIDPYFVNYRDRGWKAEHMGPDEFMGTPVYVLRITPIDCQQHTFYIDRSTYRVRAERRTAPVHARGTAVDTLIAFSDYRPVAGVLFPFHIQELNAATGEVLDQGGWEKIEANTISDGRIFSPPPAYPGPETQLVLDMLEASETQDAATVFKMYEQFRAAHPAADMADDLDWLGYEFLKADRYELAIQTFQAEIAAQPASSNGWDSLGDAYEQMGDLPVAVSAFERAVELNTKAQGSAAKLKRVRERLKNAK